MTIDKAKAILEHIKYGLEAIDDKQLHLDMNDIYDSLSFAINSFEELKWYRSQNLIRRDDAINTLTQMEWHDSDGYPVEDYEDKKQYATDWIEQIPKAEPPKDNEVVMKPIDGDCETCDYFDTDYCEKYCSYRKAEERLLDEIRNGDCETCMHYGEHPDIYCFGCVGISDSANSNHYEPYIPSKDWLQQMIDEEIVE